MGNAAVPSRSCEHTRRENPENAVLKTPCADCPKTPKIVLYAQGTAVFGTQGPEVRILSRRPPNQSWRRTHGRDTHTECNHRV
jgi:hypothetical protein